VDAPNGRLVKDEPEFQGEREFSAFGDRLFEAASLTLREAREQGQGRVQP
jgi:hypothetical protein